jgi:predicted DNA-binding protein with PD1-like motif
MNAFKSGVSLLLAGAGALVFTSLLSAQQPQSVPEGYLGHTALKEGMAPKIKVTEFAKSGRQFEVVFGKGDEVMSGLTDFATKYHLTGTSHFTAVGAFDKATLGWYDPDKRAFKKIEINQEVEILAFTGNIVIANGKPNVHAHVIVALPDGTTRGGHVVEGQISLTMQLFLEELEPLSNTVTAKSDQ